MVAIKTKQTREEYLNYFREYNKKRRQNPEWLERELKRLRELSYKNRDFVQSYKMEHGCNKCGFNEYPEALELDHIDPDTKHRRGTTAVKYSWSRNKIKKELTKCQVLCIGCHRIRTAEQTGWGTNKRPYIKTRFYDLQEYKRYHGCNKCGYNDNPILLDIDHIDTYNKSRDRSGNPMKLTHMSDERLQNELLYCRVLCVFCHRRRTMEQKRKLKKDR